jgi:hypothetical protein
MRMGAGMQVDRMMGIDIVDSVGRVVAWVASIGVEVVGMVGKAGEGLIGMVGSMGLIGMGLGSVVAMIVWWLSR